MSIGRLSLVIALACAACGDDGKSPADGGTDTPHGDATDAGGDGRTTVATIPATPNRNLDLLFVVDDSPSMLDKQRNLVDNFPNFINTLDALPGGLPNVHVAVVTSDMGTSAAEDGAPGPTIGQVGQGGCAGSGKAGTFRTAAPITGSFISDVADTSGARLKNYTGTLADAFAQLATAGAGGCGFEQTLAAMKAALSGNPANAGFLRADAMLGVVFLTDEDDCSARHTSLFAADTTTLGPLQSFRCTRFGVTCSGGGTTSDAMNQVGAKTGCVGTTGGAEMTDVKPFHDFLISLKGDAQKVVVAAIMGTPDPFQVELRAPAGSTTAIPALAHSCQYQGRTAAEVADPPARLRQFLDMFPNASTFATICQPDQSGALQQIGQLVSRGVGSPCITEDLGASPDCVAVDTVGTTETTIPACGPSPAPPCWRLSTDAATCPLGGHQKLIIDRAAAPDPATITSLRCTL